jgi:hypothetical protein
VLRSIVGEIPSDFAEALSMVDLALRDLGQFTGTESYHMVLGFKVTDGILYLTQNGYAWVITDTLAVIKCRPDLRAQPFLAIKLKVKNSEADVTIEDGNDKEFYRQHYDFTDAKRDLILFFEDGVLLLATEH